MKLAPQPGSQVLFASSPARIAIYSGTPGSGKSHAGMLELFRWHAVPGFTGAAFRKNARVLFNAGGLFSTLEKFGRAFGAHVKRSSPPVAEWTNGSAIYLHHAAHGDSEVAHDGAEYCGEFFDELQHFDPKFFWYLAVTRNRSTCGVTPFVRASCMPQADSLPHELVRPWIFADGWPDYAQSGVVRWIFRDPRTELIRFFDSERDALDEIETYGDPLLYPISLAVIHARTDENHVLMDANPQYKQGWAMADRVTRLRIEGNWNARPLSAGMFDRQWYAVLDELPAGDVIARARGWDLAATAPSEANSDPDWTRSALLALLSNGQVVVEDMVSTRDRPGPVDDLLCKTAAADGVKVTQSFFRDPGAAGVRDEAHIRALLGRVLHCGRLLFTHATKNKIEFAKPASAYADRTREPRTAGFAVLRRGWNGAYFAEVEEFPRPKNAVGERVHDDQVDAQSAAWIGIQDRVPGTTTKNGVNKWLEAMAHAR